jgi:hypothetical protein
VMTQERRGGTGGHVFDRGRNQRVEVGVGRNMGAAFTIVASTELLERSESSRCCHWSSQTGRRDSGRGEADMLSNAGRIGQRALHRKVTVPAAAL